MQPVVGIVAKAPRYRVTIGLWLNRGLAGDLQGYSQENQNDRHEETHSERQMQSEREGKRVCCHV